MMKSNNGNVDMKHMIDGHERQQKQQFDMMLNDYTDDGRRNYELNENDNDDDDDDDRTNDHHIVYTIPSDKPDNIVHCHCNRICQVTNNDPNFISKTKTTTPSKLQQLPTCQVKIEFFISSPNNNNHNNEHNNNIVLTSLDHFGNPKTIGGDEFYIRYEQYDENNNNDNKKDNNETNKEQKPIYQAVAITKDCKNGKYHSQFVTTPTSFEPYPRRRQNGILTIYFEYTLGIGKLPPPNKNNWIDGGYYINTTFHITNIYPPPNIRLFNHYSYNNDTTSIPTPTSATNTNNINDTRTTIEQQQKQQQQLQLDQYDWILCLGDSTMEQFIRQRPNKKGKYYFQSNIVFPSSDEYKIRMALTTNTVQDFMNYLDKAYGTFLSSSSSLSSKNAITIPVTTKPTTSVTTKKIALLLGSCLWDILDSFDTKQGQEYFDHQIACKQLIQNINKKYPNLIILWKSPTAVHIHVVDNDRLVQDKKEKERQLQQEQEKAKGQNATTATTTNTTTKPTLFGIDRVRYMSSSRSRYIYDCQRKIMKDLNVPFLDIYEATYLSSNWLFPSDGRHYRPDLNRLMLSWYYSNKNDNNCTQQMEDGNDSNINTEKKKNDCDDSGKTDSESVTTTNKFRKYYCNVLPGT